ncbi:uncharacterized protein lcorl isoform X2 [Stegostoma tigrinum]|uniref:uncharacterized protein lcorl isoform X2 n=1 Tax=Stegostoma tigrinum TaxID=3053191 RepID=UPI00202AEF41|nr:uncharacterized protein lcorl isoform X2 [Stegostoma tigrinum]
MASQCGSPRCTAERRGFRRELDSWRYKLIHCVGFESILEGLYGPRLLRDLSLFDDCEPEEVTDWSMNENCSFCHIRREKVKDHISSLSVPTTLISTEESLSQGQSHTEQLECQADKFLNAIFHKKDLPQNCDRNIPLVAQEIMKRMIRQFAIEYISRSNYAREAQPGSTDESILVSNDPPAKQTQNFLEEQDRPLDLTVNKSHEKNFQQDGVLDLSTKKNSINSTVSTGSSPASTTIKLSGFKKETDAGVVSNSAEKTGYINHEALNEILSTLCPNHRKLLTTMLKCLIQERDSSNVQYRDQRITQFKSSSSDFNENKISEGLYNCNRFQWCENCTLQTVEKVPFPWVSCCLRNLRCLSCKKGTHGCLTIISNGVCKQCNRSNIYQICTGSYKHLSGCTNAEESTIQACSEPPDEETCSIETPKSSAFPGNVTDYSKPRSPSPPPLSPVRTDEFEIDEMSKTASAFNADSIELAITHPPSLSPEEEKDYDPVVSGQTHKSKFAEKFEEGIDGFVAVGEISRSSDSENDLEKGENSASFQEVMERINEKLKTIETTDDGQILADLFNNDSYQGSNGSFKLREIAATLLHKAKVSDYSLMELLRQHEENRIIQTRFRKRQETLIALHNSPDSPLSRRQTVQIKRDLANLDQLFSSKKSASEKFGKRLARSSTRDACSLAREYSPISEDFQSVNNLNKYCGGFHDQCKTEFKSLSEEHVSGGSRDVTECINSPESSDLDLFNILEVTEMDVETPSDSTDNLVVDPGYKDVPVVLQNSEKIDCMSNIGRAKRNILPPERFSIYITEPRKMFYAACFSENPQRKPVKAKKPDLGYEGSASEMSNTDSPMKQELLNGQDNIIVYEVTESLEVSTSSQSELIKGKNSISNENRGNKPNIPEVVPNELVDQCNNKIQKTTTVLSTDPVEAVCSMECNGPAQSDICINFCTKDYSKFVDKHGILENAVNHLLSGSPESGAANMLESNSLLGSDYLSVISPLQQKDSAEEFVGKPDGLQRAACECSVFENTNSTNKTGQNCPSSYNSPIKLMFLSKISSEKGIKYTLKSVNSSKIDTTSCISNLDLDVLLKTPEESNSFTAESSNTPEYFPNPCPKSGDTVEYFPNSVAESSHAAECLQSCSESSPACEEVNCNVEMETCSYNSSAFRSNSFTRKAAVEITDQIIELAATPKEIDESILKRKPGRPKKLGPPVEKQIKRPKGRPPKPKIELPEPVECTAEAPDTGKVSTLRLSSTDDSRNIRITVVYGRSRRFRRFVSKNDKIVINATKSDLNQTSEKQIEEMVQGSAEEFFGKPPSSASVTQGENRFDLVRPIKDKTVLLHSSGNAICPNSKPTALKTSNSGQRKPGRPAKVKISGISVTVDAVSPQERKVSINSVLPPLVQEYSPSNKLSVDASNEDGESSAIIQNDCGISSKDSLGDKKAKSVLPLRHSVRLKKPSLHFLHSFASSSSFSQSNALVHKSRKVLLNKPGNELAKNRNLDITIVSENITSNLPSVNKKEETTNEVAEFGCSSELSADPIFVSSASLKWWHTSISKQTLQEELDKQFELVNHGWLPVDPAELNNSDKRKYPGHLDRVTKSVVIVGDDKHVQVSPVQMLFQKNCNMDKICAWFMQTTETHSLSIVRKENARDPIEVLNANGVLTAGSQVNTCSNPQAEHLKKHLKKFALESPVKPRTHFPPSSRMSNLKVCKDRRKLLRLCCKPQHSSHKELSQHRRVQYEQWKSVWKCVSGNPQYQNLKPSTMKTAVSKNSKKTELEINSFPPEGEPVLMASRKENESKDKLKPVNSVDVGLSDCATVQNLNSTNYPKCKRTEKFESLAEDSEQESVLEGQHKTTFQNANWKLGNFKECRVFLRKINSLEQSHFRNYDAWQQSKNRLSDTKGTSNLQRYTEEHNDSCGEVNAFETQSSHSTGPTLYELKGKRKHKERTSNETGLSSLPSKKVQHFPSKWSMPCHIDSDHFPSLSSNSNPVKENKSQKENAEIVKSNAGKRKRCQDVSTTAATVKRLRRSSVEQRLPYNQLQFQIGNSS